MTPMAACRRCGARDDDEKGGQCSWPSGQHAFYPLAAEPEPTTEMVSVPRDLLRGLRCDVLLAFSELEGPTRATADIVRLLRQDHAELLALVPYTF